MFQQRQVNFTNTMDLTKRQGAKKTSLYLKKSLNTNSLHEAKTVGLKKEKAPTVNTYNYMNMEHDNKNPFLDRFLKWKEKVLPHTFPPHREMYHSVHMASRQSPCPTAARRTCTLWPDSWVHSVDPQELRGEICEIVICIIVIWDILTTC